MAIKNFPWACFLFILLTPFEGNHGGDYETNLNTILSPEFVCFTERAGVRCPSGSECRSSKNDTFQCKNTTDCCVSSSDQINSYYLFTPKNKEHPEFLHKCGGKLSVNSNFDRDLNTVVLIHGLFDGVCRTAAWREIMMELFIRGNYNVILVDWSRQNIPDIYDALNANKGVGRRLACVLRNIMIEKNITGKKMHLIGHSMGAHIAGFVGQYLKECDITIRRITAIDPSNFGYYGYPPNERLSRDDSQCVDAIHVNKGDCFPLFIGYKDNIGHADFYPNGGSIQFSCIPYILVSFLKLDIFYALVSLALPFCFHLQGLQYFKDSIRSCQYVGVECNSYDDFKNVLCRTCSQNGSCAVMGMDFEDYGGPCDGSHQYYLQTKLYCPYCDNSKIQLNGFLKNRSKKDPGQHSFGDMKGQHSFGDMKRQHSFGDMKGQHSFGDMNRQHSFGDMKT